MLRSPALFRAVLALSLLLAATSVAGADEAFVLDNGNVLRGRVLGEDASTFLIGLTGAGTEGRVRVSKSKVVQRFIASDGPFVPSTYGGHGEPGATSVPFRVGDPSGSATKSGPGASRDVPDEEPGAEQENFFERLTRRAVLAVPPNATARAFVAILGVVVLLCLVGLGARMAEIPDLTLGRSTLLATILGAILAAHVLWSDSLMRADVAPFVVPACLLMWVGAAAATFRCGAARAFTLLAFVLFSGALVTFATGVVLVMV